MMHYFSAASDPNVIKELSDVIDRGKCIVLIGSDLATYGWAEEKKSLSGWRSLLEKMTHWCLREGLMDQETSDDISVLLRGPSLTEAEQEIEEHLHKNEQLRKYLREILLPDQMQVREIHRLIVDIPFRACLTTNYDTSIETAYSMVKGRPLEKFYETSMQDAIIAYREDRAFILKLHGDIDKPESLMISDRAFERRLHRASNYWRDLEKLLAMSFVLFLGFDHADHDLIGFLNKIDVFNKSNRHWMVVAEGQCPPLKAKRLREDKGIHIIQYKDDETHTELTGFLKALAAPLGGISPESGKYTTKAEAVTELNVTASRQTEIGLASSQAKVGLSSSTSKSVRTIEVFYVYASKDEGLREKLEKQLSILKRQNLIAHWYPLKINAGEEWEREINKHLSTAHVILLLVSPDFLDSESIYNVQLNKAIERHETGSARVIPILLRPTLWENTPFGKINLGSLQPLPKDRKFVTSSGRNQDVVFAEIAEGIKTLIEELNTAPR